MMFMGEMRPVVSMWLGTSIITDPLRATTVVLYLADDDWATVRLTHPADVVLAPRGPTSEGRDWQTIR